MARMFRQARLLAAKDLRLLFTDKGALFFMLLLPLVFVAGFSLANPDLGTSDEQFRPLIVTLEAPDGVSHEIIGELASGEDSPFRTMPHEEALSAVESGAEEGFVAFPAGFTQQLLQGQQTALDVVVDTDQPATQAALHGVAQAIAGQLSAVSTATQAIVELRLREGRQPGAEDFAAAQQQQPLVTFDAESVGGIDAVSASNFTLTGYLTMFVFFAAALTAEGIAKERKNHTLERLMANGVRRESIVLGKYLGTVGQGLLQLAVLWAAGVLIFNVQLGAAPWAVVAVSLLMVLASAAIGIVLASIARTQQSAASFGVLVSLVLAPIGGCWWPLFITPEWMQALARLTPHGWANTAFNKLILFGADGADVLLEMGALAVFAVAFLAVAFVRFRAAPGATA
ncbi:MAG: ABC transporter permease [Dehalococcoidia bacterium]